MVLFDHLACHVIKVQFLFHAQLLISGKDCGNLGHIVLP